MESPRLFTAPSPIDMRDTQVIPAVGAPLATRLNGEPFTGDVSTSDEVLIVNIAEVRRRFGQGI